MIDNSIVIIRNVAPLQYGGAEYYQLLLANILRKNNSNPILFSNSHILIKEANKENIKTIIPPYQKKQNWSNWRNVLLPIYFIWQIRSYFWYKKQIRIISPKAIFIQSRDELICATLASKKMKKPCFWIDHADFKNWVLKNVDKPFKNLIGKTILKLAKIPKKIIMISDFEAKSFEKYQTIYKLQNIKIIKNGVIDEKEKYQTRPKKKSFCYLGRIVDHKGIQELITAFRKIEDKNATLNIYGEGEDKKKYMEAIKDDDRIIFRGYTNNPVKAISESECFVLPSYYEGLSISLLQAAMLGKTIIATDVDGNPEVIKDGETGLLVPPKDINALAKAMSEVLNNPEKAKKLGINARKKYEKEFDFDRTVKEKMVGELLNDQ